jgi:hypothetical protein
MATNPTSISKSTWLVIALINSRSFIRFFLIGFEGDVALLDDKVHLHRLPDRYTLAKEGEQLNKLFFVIHGSIAGFMKEITGAKKERKELKFERNS